jgi:hypothetical protein
MDIAALWLQMQIYFPTQNAAPSPPLSHWKVIVFANE